MKLKDHILIGGIASLGLYPVLGVKSIVFWIASILIDTDHYWDFLYHNNFRDFSIKNMVKYHSILFKKMHRPEFLGLNVFHTVESLAVVYFIALLLNSDVIMAVLWGMLFHLFLDLLYLSKNKALFKRALSIIEYRIRRKIMVGQGLSPDILYENAIYAIGRGTRYGSLHGKHQL